MGSGSPLAALLVVVVLTATGTGVRAYQTCPSPGLFCSTAQKEEHDLLPKTEPHNDEDSAASYNHDSDGGFSSLDGMLQWALGHSDPAKDVHRLSAAELRKSQLEIKHVMKQIKMLYIRGYCSKHEEAMLEAIRINMDLLEAKVDVLTDYWKQKVEEIHMLKKKVDGLTETNHMNSSVEKIKKSENPSATIQSALRDQGTGATADKSPTTNADTNPRHKKGGKIEAKDVV